MFRGRAPSFRAKFFISQAVFMMTAYTASFCIFSPQAQAEPYSQLCPDARCDLNAIGITEEKEFVGLAMYLNGVKTYIVNEDTVREIPDDDKVTLEQDSWLAVVGRFNVFLIQGPGLSAKKLGTDIYVYGSQLSDNPSNNPKVVPKHLLSSVSPVLNQLRYQQLWWPFQKLALAAEFILTNIQTHIATNWGVSMLFKLVMLPFSSMTASLQRRTSQIQAALAPKLLYIKQNYDGEEAHNNLMAAYKELGVSPFYTLKPMLGTLIQIPVLIAVFNALGEMPQLNMQSFLWVKNLAYADAVATLPVVIPGLGGHLNLLPLLMTAVTIISTMTFFNPHISPVEQKKQKRNLYMMAATFFILFYPFPAAMVLFWTINNLLQCVQQIVTDKEKVGSH